MNDTHVLVWGFATILLAAATLFAVATSFYLYDWRRQLLERPLVITPDPLRETLSRLDRALTELQETLSSDYRPKRDESLLQEMRDLQRTFLTLQTNLDQRDTEIHRLRVGYDQHIYRDFLRRFILVDQALHEELSEDASTTSALPRIAALLSDALAECHVERFSPSPGSEYRTTEGVSDDPSFLPTTDTSLSGQIAQVLRPGYRFRRADDTIEILQEAQVTVYTHKT